MYKTLLLFFFICISNTKGICQYYEAVFECILDTDMQGETDSSAAGVNNFSLHTRINYTVKADKKYLHIKGSITGLTGFPGAQIYTETSNPEIIIDLVRLIAFFPEEKIYKKVQLYELTAACSNKSRVLEYYIDGKDSTVRVQAKPGLPWFVTPGIVLSSAYRCSGINFVKSPGFTITLKDAPAIKKKNLNYKKFFQNYVSSMEYGYYSFFD